MERLVNKTLIRSLTIATIGASALACSRTDTASDDHGGPHWGYKADNGPDNWGSMNAEWALCADGLEQSPIDLACRRARRRP